VVASALPSVDDPSVSESVELGASVIVPLAESGTVDDGVSASDESGDTDVRDGVSRNTTNQHHEHNDQGLIHIPLEDFACLLIIMLSISLSALGHGHAAA
jgi:hypothetical protein